jgi:hypothetical protein
VQARHLHPHARQGWIRFGDVGRWRGSACKQQDYPGGRRENEVPFGSPTSQFLNGGKSARTGGAAIPRSRRSLFRMLRSDRTS